MDKFENRNGRNDGKLSLPTVTFIMPSHNRKNQLERALKALAIQNYPSELLDMVLVLDGCSDGSAQMVEALKPALPYRITLIERAQGGPAAARNTAVRAATGEIILFIDDDIVATPQLVTEHIRLHLEDDQAVVLAPMATPHDHVRPIWVQWEEYALELKYRDMENGRYEPTARQFFTGNCSLKRRWFLATGEFDEELKRAEDIEFAFRLEQKCKVHFYFNPSAIGYHYAYRTFESWKRAQYLYGRYDVIMDREKGHTWISKAILEEFLQRDIIVRMLVPLFINYNWVKGVVGYVFLLGAHVLKFMGFKRLAFKSLSCFSNILYWQGLNEEMINARNTKPTEPALMEVKS
jgi:GT2 family glycosyltransferase